MSKKESKLDYTNEEIYKLYPFLKKLDRAEAGELMMAFIKMTMLNDTTLVECIGCLVKNLKE